MTNSYLSYNGYYIWIDEAAHMGMYDTYCNYTKEQWLEEVAKEPDSITVNPPGWIDVQLKVGDVCCNTYHIGDDVPDDLPDGLYLGNFGFISIQGQKVAGVYDDLKNCRGEQLCRGEDIAFGNTEHWSILYGKNFKVGTEDEALNSNGKRYYNSTPLVESLPHEETTKDSTVGSKNKRRNKKLQNTSKSSKVAKS